MGVNVRKSHLTQGMVTHPVGIGDLSWCFVLKCMAVDGNLVSLRVKKSAVILLWIITCSAVSHKHFSDVCGLNQRLRFLLKQSCVVDLAAPKMALEQQRSLDTVLFYGSSAHSRKYI